MVKANGHHATPTVVKGSKSKSKSMGLSKSSTSSPSAALYFYSAPRQGVRHTSSCTPRIPRSEIGLHAFLSNYERKDLTVFGHRFASAEAAYQFAKFDAPATRAFARLFHYGEEGGDGCAQPPRLKTPHMANVAGQAGPGFRQKGSPSAEVREVIRLVRQASAPAEEGGGGVRMRPELESEGAKLGAMLAVLRAKFADEGLRKRLLATGSRPLVEHTSRDRFWGDGGPAWGEEATGQNWLGRCLMQVRGELRGAAEGGGAREELERPWAR